MGGRGQSTLLFRGIKDGPKEDFIFEFNRGG